MTPSTSSGQLDLFGAAPAAPLPLSPALAAPAARIVIPPRPSPAAAFAGVEPATLEILAGVELLAEMPDPLGTWPRVAVGRAGWEAAMAERARLVERLLAGTLNPGQAEALAALQRLELARTGEALGGIEIAAFGLEDLQQALAGLRLAATEEPHA